ncbi:hypothetical protein PR048_009331 [Dryococelus australis]|uniref:Reverse transcriptase Ty1/copia-type domain-containing protein n=1 Tax=Dryococelus australis TaxID=614101 RepID=A0ABQ9HZK1_9NEOP|nr:hypothetical protein PR048_009331 [Dryococelus australis]
MDFQDKEGWPKEGKTSRKRLSRRASKQCVCTSGKITNHLSLLITIALSRKWEIRQLDVPTAFLNGYVDDIYIKIPDGVKNEPGSAQVEEKSVRSALSTWEMEREISQHHEDTWYEEVSQREKTQVENFIRLLKGEFKAKDLGILSEFLRTMMEMNFINKILSKFNMIFCKGVNTPLVFDFQVDTEEPANEKFMFQQLIGSLMYVATVSRPDISYSVCYLSIFLNKPTEQLWKAGKRDLCLTFKPSSDDKLICYSDSDWAGDKLDRKSVSGCVLLHGKNTILWGSRKQGTVALSTAEAEYIACATTACDLVYLQGVLQDLQSATSTPVLLTDNQSAIDMAESCKNKALNIPNEDMKSNFVVLVSASRLLVLLCLGLLAGARGSTSLLLGRVARTSFCTTHFCSLGDST